MPTNTDDRRVVNSDGLIRLGKIAEAYEFNRQVNLPVLEERLDPDGVNVLFMLLLDHSRPAPKMTRGRKQRLIALGLDPDVADPMHDRVHVLAKVKDSMEPVQFDLDVPHDIWMGLPTPDALRKAMARGEE